MLSCKKVSKSPTTIILGTLRKLSLGFIFNREQQSENYYKYAKHHKKHMIKR